MKMGAKNILSLKEPMEGEEAQEGMFHDKQW